RGSREERDEPEPCHPAIVDGHLSQVEEPVVPSDKPRDHGPGWSRVVRIKSFAVEYHSRMPQIDGWSVVPRILHRDHQTFLNRMEFRGIDGARFYRKVDLHNHGLSEMRASVPPSRGDRPTETSGLSGMGILGTAGPRFL